ncbi:xylose isomerase [Terrimonas sp.]|uniref:sugar phosphate isomerase/epimerase family protein n=1 Tax=Terrimonas sp. TaxID=1914338 RepID=UPI000D5097C2|nr:sugar phosphate isomerase/epimerase family protein [Terrimonas sp.]PVD49903.1 xylose isomerase [Terrimonas sp.]
MKNFNRRDFLKSSAALLPIPLIGYSFDMKATKPLLSFSTLGCPDWSFDEILSFAARHGFSGIEFRGLHREIDLSKAPDFSAANIRTSLQKLKQHKLRIINLGASTALHYTNKAEREKNIDEAKRYIDLAQQLNCPYIRVFPNKLPKDDTRNAVIELIIDGLKTLGDYAKNTKVTVLMETHGDVVYTADLVRIMESVNHPKVALVWDIANMWTITKEPPAEVYPKLKPYIRHTHIKDATLDGDKVNYVLLSKGQVPIFEAIDLLHKDGYKGFYSFEWEKLWHPELMEPDIAFADYAKVMKEYFKI